MWEGKWSVRSNEQEENLKIARGLVGDASMLTHPSPIITRTSDVKADIDAGTTGDLLCM